MKIILLGIVMNFNENIKYEKIRKNQWECSYKITHFSAAYCTWYYIKTLLSQLLFCTRLRRLRLIPIKI